MNVFHVLMGMAMAVMLVPITDPVPKAVWIVLFSVATLWFIFQMVRDWPKLRGLAPGRRVWHWHHIIESAAMLYMVSIMPAAASMTGSMDMSGMSGMSGMSDMPGMQMTSTTPSPLETSIAVALVGYFVVFAVFSAVRVGRVPTRAALATGGATGSSSIELYLSPRLAIGCHTVMAVGMAYGFALMI